MGAINISCPGCGKAYSLPAEHAGNSMTCGACGAVMRVPGAAAGVPQGAARNEKPCPYCGEMILPAATVCRHCKTDLVQAARGNYGAGDPTVRKSSVSTMIIVLACAAVGVVLVIGVLAALLLPALAAARKSAKKRDCTNNLRQLGTYVVMYVSKYGQDRYYPPANGQNFWNTLRTVPASQPMVYDNALFVCKVMGTPPSPMALDYRIPNPAAYGAKLTCDELTRPNYPIGADRTTNHDINGNDDINVLFFGGSVMVAGPGDTNWTMAITDSYTLDPR